LAVVVAAEDHLVVAEMAAEAGAVVEDAGNKLI